MFPAQFGYKIQDFISEQKVKRELASYRQFFLYSILHTYLFLSIWINCVILYELKTLKKAYLESLLQFPIDIKINNCKINCKFDDRLIFRLNQQEQSHNHDNCCLDIEIFFFYNFKVCLSFFINIPVTLKAWNLRAVIRYVVLASHRAIITRGLYTFYPLFEV